MGLRSSSRSLRRLTVYMTNSGEIGLFLRGRTTECVWLAQSSKSTLCGRASLPFEASPRIRPFGGGRAVLAVRETARSAALKGQRSVLSGRDGRSEVGAWILCGRLQGAPPRGPT
jgi:hypothetical protein